MCPIPALAIHEPARILPKGGEVETCAGLRRPRLLMSAARHGLGEYRRARDLLRLLGYCPNAALAVEDLTRMEAEAEAARRAGNPGMVLHAACGGADRALGRTRAGGRIRKARADGTGRRL